MRSRGSAGSGQERDLVVVQPCNQDDGTEPRLKQLGCLLIADHLPTARRPFGGIALDHHVKLASSIFGTVHALANCDYPVGVISRQVATNVTIYEGQRPFFIKGKIATIAILGAFVYRGLSLIRNHKIDVVIAHGIKWAGFVGAVVSLITRRPFFLFVHSASPANEQSVLLKMITRISARTARKVIFVSQGQAARYASVYRFSSSCIMGNQVDTDLFRPCFNGSSQAQPAVAVFAGRPTQAKGFPVLLSIIERAITDGINVRFLILTDTDLLSEQDQGRIRALSDRVVLQHYASPERFAEYLNQSSFLISLSQFESFSLVIAEAMSCGKPVLATACDGPSELVRSHSGRLVPIDSEEDAYRELIWMIENIKSFDPTEIRASIVSRFSEPVMREKYTECFCGSIN